MEVAQTIRCGLRLNKAAQTPLALSYTAGKKAQQQESCLWFREPSVWLQSGFDMAEEENRGPEGLRLSGSTVSLMVSKMLWG